MKTIEEINQSNVKKILAEKKIPEFFPGDIIKVGVRSTEGKRDRIQYFEGVCIAKKNRDIFQNKKISDIGGKGVFSKQIDDELLDQKVDLAVHSLKDLPTKMTDGLCVNAVVKRNDPRDAFLSYSSKSFSELKSQSIIGTSSFRRQAQLNLLRSDIKIVPMRGNIDTRIEKLKNKEFDAIVLSLAGIQMLNLINQVKEIFSIEQMLPAIGQGAIALQCKKDDKKTLNILKGIND